MELGEAGYLKQRLTSSTRQCLVSAPFRSLGSIERIYFYTMCQWSSITVAACQPIGRYSATVPIIAPISLAGAISISNTVPMRNLHLS
jgi:hypothetical protein